MKKVLWVSRHPLDPKALDALGADVDDVDVEKKEILFHSNGEEAYRQLLSAAEGCTMVGGVFPSQLWVAIVRGGVYALPFKLFQVISIPAVTADGVTRVFNFDHLEVV